MVVSEEQNLSTKLNTDSFNYDFHLKQISNKIRVEQKKSFNVSQQIINLLSFYKTPPKFAKNYIDALVLRVKLHTSDINVDEFLDNFCSQAPNYDFKLYKSKKELDISSLRAQSVNLAAPNQNPKQLTSSQSFIGIASSGAGGGDAREKDEQDAIKYAFYKVEG